MTFEKMLQKIKNKIHYLILAALLAATIFVWQVVFAQRVDDKIKIDFFDVGQGSAILIDAPNNNQVLV